MPRGRPTTTPALRYALAAAAATSAWWIAPCGAVRKGEAEHAAPQQGATDEGRRLWADGGFKPERVTTEMVGDMGTHEYRRFFKDATTGQLLSPWHDLPLHTGAGTPAEMWMVTEIPKMTSAKYEIHTEERMNPIAQDTKNGKLRHYHGPIFWNYGFLPQTWEDPTEVHKELHVKGDNDPLDVVEIGTRTCEKGAVTRVKVLGVLAMIDHGELDWKVIAVSTEDELAETLETVHDLEASMPHVVSGIREWFRWYKAPDGKLNEFGYGGHALSREKAIEVIEETHAAWKRLYTGEIKHGALWVGDDEA